MAEPIPRQWAAVPPAFGPGAEWESRSTLDNSHTDFNPPEVVPMEYHHPQSHEPEAAGYSREGQKQFMTSTYAEKSYGPADLTPEPPKRRRRRFIILGVVIFVLIAAGIIGGVLGSRRRGGNSSKATLEAPASPSSSSSSSSTSSSQSSTATSSPRQSNNGLTVAGWRTQTRGITLRVFYQDKDDDGLRFSEYNGDGWGDSIKVDREGVASDAKLGATAIMDVIPPQYELFFQNTSHQVSGNNFREFVANVGGNFDSIDNFPIRAHALSRLATYWPYFILQKPDGTLSVVNYLPYDPDKVYWQNESLDIEATIGSALAIVPLTKTYKEPCRAALVYRRPNGVLSLHSLERDANGRITAEELQSADIGTPSLSSFGAFAVARENDLSDGVTIYILYQTGSNDLEYIYNNGDSWESGTPSDVLKNADPSTDITCLTESVLGSITLSSEFDMSRCFFYSGGQIKHVQFDGKTWTEAKSVPQT